MHKKKIRKEENRGKKYIFHLREKKVEVKGRCCESPRLWIIRLDCPCALPVQHLWHPSVVSSPFHPHPHQTSQRPGQCHRIIPLVCRRLHHPLLLSSAALRIQPVVGWMASSAGCGCASAHFAVQHPADKSSAEEEPSVSAPCIAILGIPATLGPLAGSMGQSCWYFYSHVLLLLQMLPHRSCCGAGTHGKNICWKQRESQHWDVH